MKVSELKSVVHKFGGSSVANVECLQHVVDIVRKEYALVQSREGDGSTLYVVVSAFGGVTNAIVELIELAEGRREYQDKLSALHERHLAVLQHFENSIPNLPAAYRSKASQLCSKLQQDIQDIADVLRAVYLCRSHCNEMFELLTGYGEQWSVQILRLILELQLRDSVRCEYMDARDVLVVDKCEGTNHPWVQWGVCRAKFEAWRNKYLPAGIVVVTGYIASNSKGLATTLQRNGSDFSATILGALCLASSVTIWTDVNGVFTADPSKVESAQPVLQMSYEEAVELSYFGAKVLHPLCLSPLIEPNIPLYIRNTFNYENKGTKVCRISNETQTEKSSHNLGSLIHPPVQNAVKGFSSIENLALLNVEG